MTSSRKKHHPEGAPVPPQPPPTAFSRRTWTIRVIAVLGLAVGVTMALVGVRPEILGGYGKIALTVPGMIIVAASFIAFVETTPYARSKRR